MACGAAAQETAQLPLIDRTADGRRIGYWLPVHAGNGESAMMLLDTGSRGLMIMADKLGKQGIERTGRRMRHGFLDGTTFEGEIVKARVNFGPVSTAGLVFLLSVDKAYCAKDKPDCPAQKFNSKSIGGIMGVGLGDVGPLDNPLTCLPSPLSGGYIFHGGGHGSPASLSLGLTPGNRQGFTMYPMPRMTLTANWRDAFFKHNTIDVCVSIGEAGIDKLCGKILFDSGSSLNLLQTKSPPAPGAIVRDGLLRPGMKIDIVPAGMAPVAATSEAAQWSGLTRVIQGGDGRTILGASSFQILDILYDFKGNAIGVRPAR